MTTATAQSATSGTGPRRKGPAAKLLRNNLARIGLCGISFMVLVAIFGPMVMPNDPFDQNLFNRLQPPSGEFLLGTDQYGRDVLSRVIMGTRYSILIGFTAAASAFILGTALGIFSGYLGGRADQLMVEAVNIMMVFPGILLGILIVAVLGSSFVNLIVTITFILVPRFIRVSRGLAISLKERDFVMAAQALGQNRARVMAKHILPNLVSEVLVMATLWTSTAILAEAGLSFLGLGIQPPLPSWGGMIRDGIDIIQRAPWLSVYPGLAILVTVLSLNLVGDGVRDAIDPRISN
ncbi:MAG: ABC transporter permease [Trueperaceae bacterium]